MRGEVTLFLDWVVRAFVGHDVGEQRLDHGVDTGGHFHPGERVESDGQVPHAFGVDP